MIEITTNSTRGMTKYQGRHIAVPCTSLETNGFIYTFNWLEGIVDNVLCCCPKFPFVGNPAKDSELYDLADKQYHTHHEKGPITSGIADEMTYQIVHTEHLITRKNQHKEREL